jgi:protein-S-isoprenylcysteine O-methyltransferase Ste14
LKWLELRVPPPLVMAVVAVLMGFAARMLPALDFPVPARIALAVALALVGVLIGVVAIVQFWRARTTPNPMKPHDSSRLVDAGIYRLSRNPMYLGDALLLLAWALWLANALAFVGVPLFVAYMNRFQIAVEERVLQARFGAGYDAYRRAVRRWI